MHSRRLRVGRNCRGGTRRGTYYEKPIVVLMCREYENCTKMLQVSVHSSLECRSVGEDTEAAKYADSEDRLNSRLFH